MTTVSTYTTAAPAYTYPVEAVVWSATVSCTDGDVIQGPAVKAGWKILGVKLGYTATASSAAHVGDGSDDDRFIASAATTTSGVLSTQREPTLSSGAIATGPGYVYAADDTIDITITGANVSTKVYSMLVEYQRTF